MLIYSYSKSINTEELLLETKIVLKYKKVVKKKKESLHHAVCSIQNRLFPQPWK